MSASSTPPISAPVQPLLGSVMSAWWADVNTASAGNLNYPVLAAADDASQIQVL